MSEEVQKIVDSVRTGNNIKKKKSFKDAMTAKVGDALEVRRQEVSSTIVKTIVPEDSVDDNVNEE